jgi:hypothetical protein
MITMRSITIQFTSEAGEDVGINIAAEPGDAAVVRISRAGPLPGDDPRLAWPEELAIRAGISAMSWGQVHPAAVHAVELGKGLYSLMAPAPAEPPAEVAEAIRQRVAASCVARTRDFDVNADTLPPGLADDLSPAA